MRRSDIEKDAAFILASMSERDYEIPSNKDIFKVIFGWLRYIYGLQVFFVALASFIYREPGNVSYLLQRVIELSSISFVFMLIFTLVFIAATYSNVCISIILGEDIKRKSILLRIVEKKVRFYGRLLLIVNSLVGCVLLWVGEPFIAGLGISWFVTFGISVLLLHGSLSRYMTPAVVSSLSKVKEMLSASPK